MKLKASESKSKLYLFTDDPILYAENPKELKGKKKHNY